MRTQGDRVPRSSITRTISINAAEMTSVTARQVAAALVDAADELDRLQLNATG
jgi:hypothetical protein